MVQVRKYQRGKVWWVRYTRNGVDVRESLKTADTDIAERERNAIEGELLNPHLRVKQEKNPSLDRLWEKYEEWAVKHVRPRTIDTTRTNWEHLVEFTGAERLGDISRADAEAFKHQRIQQGNSQYTANNHLRSCQAVINRAIREGWFTGTNPFVEVERFKLDTKLPQFHTEQETLRLLKHAKKRGRDCEWVVLLGGWAGLRRMELCHCRWEWFLWDKRAPVVLVMAHEGFRLKDREERAVPMSRRIWNAFYPHRQDEGFVFKRVSTNKGPARYRGDRKKVLVTALQDAGLPIEKAFQRLRSSFGSVHVQKGKSIFVVSRWLGHSSVSVTERHYTGLQAYDPDIDAW